MLLKQFFAFLLFLTFSSANAMMGNYSSEENKRENTYVAVSPQLSECYKDDHQENRKVEIPYVERTHFETIDSTLVYANKISTPPPSKWQLYTANAQTNGMESLTRTWVSPPNCNIHASYRLSWPENKLDRLLNITQIASLSVAQTLEEYGFQPKFKFPNDIYLNGKKVSGSNGSSQIGGTEIATIINIGLNVNMDPGLCNTIDQPATSMFVESGKRYSREVVLGKITHKLYNNINLLLETGFVHNFLSSLTHYFEAFKDQQYAITPNGKIYRVFFRGLTENGLMIAKINGVNRRIYQKITFTEATAKSEIGKDLDKQKVEEEEFSEGVAEKIQEKIPDHLDTPLTTQKGMGLRWGSQHGKDSIRIDKGDPDAEFPHQKTDHVRINSNGKVIGRNGHPIQDSPSIPKPKKSPEAHIPLSEWLEWKQWNKP